MSMEKNVIIRMIMGTIVVLVLTMGMFALVSMINRNTQTGDSGKLGKTLVVYFSAQNHTGSVARRVASRLDADVFEIKPQDEYTSEDLTWTNSNSRVAREHNNSSLRDVKLAETTVKKWDDYDTVLIGYPIWWGIAAWPVSSFVKTQDFSGKVVVPFCTSSSSGIGDSGELLKREANGGEWRVGRRFPSDATDDEISEWIESIR